MRTTEDFALAGRRLGAPSLVGTLVATWTGTGSLFSNAEFAVRLGVSAFLLPVASGVGIVSLAANVLAMGIAAVFLRIRSAH